MIQAIEDTISDFSDNIVYCDVSTILTEISAAFVASPGGEEGSVMGEDFEGNHLQVFKDADQDVKDFVIEGLADTLTEIRKGGFAGNHIERDTGVGSVGPTPVIIVQNRQDLVGIEASVQITKEIDEEDTGGIVARRTERGIAMGDQGANEGEIDQRRDHPGKTPANRAIGQDFDESLLELVMGKQVGFGKRNRVRERNFGINFIEFCTNMINGEFFEGAHHEVSPGFRLRFQPRG
jgi:hypothetical protein